MDHTVFLRRPVAAALLLLAIAPAAPARQTETPQIRRTADDYEVLLPAAMWRALEATAPGFAPFDLLDYEAALVAAWRESQQFEVLPAAIGDFNGDGVLDAALLGRAKRRRLLMIVLSAGGGYHAEVFRESPERAGSQSRPHLFLSPRGVPAIQEALHLYPAGTEIPCWSDGPTDEDLPIEQPLILTTDAFEYIYLEKAASAWFLRDGKWERCTTAD